jgi:hypothetical protein
LPNGKPWFPKRIAGFPLERFDKSMYRIGKVYFSKEFRFRNLRYTKSRISAFASSNSGNKKIGVDNIHAVILFI